MSAVCSKDPDMTVWEDDAVFMKLWQAKNEAEQCRIMIKRFEDQRTGWDGIYDKVIQELNRRGKTVLDIQKMMTKFDKGNKTLIKVDLNKR